MDKIIPNEVFVDQIKSYKGGNKEALNDIVAECTSLVKSMARKYFGVAQAHNILVEDLEQECYVALLGAVDHFPIDVPNSNFFSFACTSMNYAVVGYFRYNTNRIVKTDIERGSATFQSFDVMNDDSAAARALEDITQQQGFLEVENEIDQTIQRKEIDSMLSDIIHTDAEFLKDVYGLNGKYYSWDELCKKYNITMKELITKERQLIVHIGTSPKLQEYTDKIDCSCKEAYHYGVKRFKESGMSSTEFLVMKRMKEGESA